MVGAPHVQKRIEQTRQVAAEDQRGHPGLVRLKGQGDDVAHQPHVIADILRKSVVRALEGEERPAAILGPLLGHGLILAQAVHSFLNPADAGEILVQAAAVVRADA